MFLITATFSRVDLAAIKYGVSLKAGSTIGSIALFAGSATTAVVSFSEPVAPSGVVVVPALVAVAPPVGDVVVPAVGVVVVVPPEDNGGLVYPTD